MSKDITDDPGQVLAILNSLGVVGVTASELKAFMKELKLYRKVKEKECQQWKEKIKTKILQKQEFSENVREQVNVYKKQEYSQTVTEQINVYKSNIRQNAAVQKQELRRSRGNEETQDHCPRIVISKKQCHTLQENKENSVNDIKSIPITIKYGSPASKKKPKRFEEPKEPQKKQKEQRESPKCSASIDVKSTEKVIYRQSRRRSKSLASPVSSRRRSKSLASPISSRRNGSAGSRSRSKSFIRSQNPYPEPRSTKSCKKMSNDPVTLYNRYKLMWEQLSLPGEKSHSKLRWAVREKMLGSTPVPKPTVPPKRLPKSAPSTGRRR